ncbi:MAG: hypothetical protein IJI35_12175 [Kiritimatiellae bacterium]|nr:hypothetical protein [Kiritimatiellia bacterium]
MTSHSRRNFSVTVFLNRKSKASRDQTAGVFQFAAQHDGWAIHLYSRPETPADLNSLARSMTSPPNGIISGGIKVVEALRRNSAAGSPPSSSTQATRGSSTPTASWRATTTR